MEIWKDIKGYEGYYQISNLGGIKSFPRNGTISTVYMLKPTLTKNGYYKVTLSKPNNTTYLLVHRIVAETFIPNPENKPEVNHIDGDKLNNCVDNLEWCTSKENITHSIKTGLKPNDKGILSPNAKLKKEDIEYCRKVYIPKDKVYGCIALAKKFKVSKSTMSYVLNYKTYY